MIAALIDDFVENLPHRPRYMEAGAMFSRYSTKGDALAAPRIQFNQPRKLFWIAVDVDHSSETDPAVLRWEDADLPPTLIVQNLTGKVGNCHLLYRLAEPLIVPESINKATAFFAAVRRGITAAVGGDKGYAHFLCKNPFQAERFDFRVTSARSQPWSLKELARRVDMSSPVGEVEVDIGRNCTTFRYATKWSKRNCYRFSNAQEFHSAVLEQCNIINAAFPEPLRQKEVERIAASVASYGFKHFRTPPASKQGKWKLDRSIPLKERQSFSARFINDNRSLNTWDRIVSLRYKNPMLTQTEIANQLGLDVRTIKRHWKATEGRLSSFWYRDIQRHRTALPEASRRDIAAHLALPIRIINRYWDASSLQIEYLGDCNDESFDSSSSVSASVIAQAIVR